MLHFKSRRRFKPQVGDIPERFAHNGCPDTVMTVGALIAKLSHFPADLPVEVGDNPGVCLRLVNGVEGQAGDPSVAIEEAM